MENHTAKDLVGLIVAVKSELNLMRDTMLKKHLWSERVGLLNHIRDSQFRKNALKKLHLGDYGDLVGEAMTKVFSRKKCATIISGGILNILVKSSLHPRSKLTIKNVGEIKNMY